MATSVPASLPPPIAIASVEPLIERFELLILVLAFGIVYLLIAYGYHYLRTNIYRERDNLDRAFDAGGTVSAGLTASMIVSQWTWAATLLQSSGVGSRYGIAGPYWYASGATVQILLFAIISVNLKTKAPGAKTFPQIIHARFGSAAHIVFVVFALMTNIIVTAMLMVGGAAVMTTLVKGLSVPYAALLVAVVAGAVTIIGNLGAALHVAYMTTSLMLLIILYFSFRLFTGGSTSAAIGAPDLDEYSIVGSAPYIYQLISRYEELSAIAAASTTTSPSPPLTTAAFLISNSQGAFSFISPATTTTTTTTAAANDLDLLGLPAAAAPPAISNFSFSDITQPTLAPSPDSPTFLTLNSLGGLFFGIINVVGNFGTVFVDQSYWQLSVAAKPRDGVLGFLLGGLVWFGVPLGFATTMSSGYLALCGERGLALLTSDQVNSGLVPPTVAAVLFGKTGAFLVLILVYMAVLSTATAEVIAVASLIVFDVYRIYLQPFRAPTTTATAAAAGAAMNACVMCGKPRGRLTTRDDGCVCVSLEQCANCLADDRKYDQQQQQKESEEKNKFDGKKNSTKLRLTRGYTATREYTCPMHAAYRKYQENLAAKKTWAVCLCSMALVPLTIFLYEIGVSLAWLYLAMGIIIGSAVVPITLAITWARLTRNAVLVGSILGGITAIVVWFVLAGVLYDGGLYNFFENTGRDVPMLFGNLTALLFSAVLTVGISLWETRDGQLRVGEQQVRTRDEQELWRMTMDIDNPLFPWAEMYQKTLGLKKTDALDQRPSVASLARAFRQDKYIAYIGSIALTIGMLVVWPAIAAALGTLSQSQYIGWISVTTGWAFCGALAITVIPAWSEIRHALEARKKHSRYSNSVDTAALYQQNGGVGGHHHQNGGYQNGYTAQQQQQQEMEMVGGDGNI